MTCCNHQCREGRDCPFTLQMHRIPGLHTEDGGRAVQGGFGVSLAMPLEEVQPWPEPIPDATATDRTDWIGQILLWIFGALAFVLTAAAVFGVRLP